MKKWGVILLVSVLLFSIISINLVSAGLIGDVWDKITGEVTENLTEPEVCGDGICQEGEVCDIDCCEAFCTLECPNGAVEGSCGCECIAFEPPIEPLCIEAGQETWAGDPNCCEGLKAVSDCLPDQGCPISLRYCVDCGNGKCESHENWYNCLTDCEQEEPPEKQCNEGEEKYYECSDGTKVPECICENEKWVCIISPKENCPDVGPGPETCATRIKVTFNKYVYKIGDPVKIIIEIFDSQGNHLPNYAFYGQMYDDRWHTPDLQKTDSKGYFIHTGTAEKPGGGVTEVKFKVYTKESSSCNSVEDTTEVKVELRECGIGGCVPEPECRDKVRRCGGICPPCPEDDEDSDIFYACRGCDVDGKCYPYGYRKDGNYCSDENNVFVGQLIGDGKCDNNFECETNLCINGNCVSSNVWNKFLEWFKKAFGGGEGPELGPEICSKSLIEKNIEDYEYVESTYGSNKGAQAPLYSDDCEKIGTVKCCTAEYDKDGEPGVGLACLYEDRQYVENLVQCDLKELGVLEEYKGEEVFREGHAIIWTHKNYVLAIGIASPGVSLPSSDAPFPEPVAESYLKKYKSDLAEIDMTYISRIPHINPKPLEFCTEEDGALAKECHHSFGGAGQSDPSSLDETEEGKRRCKESRGYGEGCCEVYTGCIMPDENCEEITIVSTDECYWHVARLNDDVDLCEKITDIHYKDKCLRDFAITGKDSNPCEKIIDIDEKKECYAKIADITEDSSVCEKIDDSEHRNKCYVNAAEHTGDAGICDKVDDNSLREKCYFWAAGEAGDVGVCAGIVDSSLQNECYVGVAEKTGDASFCDKITDSHIGDKCYRDVGIQTNDRSLCEKIIEEYTKQKCLDNTS